MKKVYTVLCAGGVLLIALLLLGSEQYKDIYSEPVIRQQASGIILAVSKSQLVLSISDEASVKVIDTSGADESIGDVGDLVNVETQLHSDNSETLCSISVVQENAITAEEATQQLDEFTVSSRGDLFNFNRTHPQDSELPADFSENTDLTN